MKRLTATLVIAVLCTGAHAADIEVVKDPVELKAEFPGEVGYDLKLDADWSAVRELRLSVTLPDDVPKGTTMLVYLLDEQYNWYQYEPSRSLRSGKTTQVRIDMSAGSAFWTPRGHSRLWDGYVAHNIRGFGIKVFNDNAWNGTVRIERIYGRTGSDAGAPLAVKDLRVNSEEVPKYGKYEMSFDLTRSYDNPFNPDEIDVRARFTSPSGKVCEHFGFYYQDYVRRKSPTGQERLTPVGRSYWKVRWTPDEAGEWKVELRLTDDHLRETHRLKTEIAKKKGEPAPDADEAWKSAGPLVFQCTPSEHHGFVRRDPKDPMWFAYDDGAFFYAVGQMLRSPTDLRQAYPYEFEIPEGEGTYAFDRMLKKLSDSGVNFVRMWMGIWWVGLEAPREYAAGYAGLGRYNMRHAWMLDHILEECERLDVKLKLTVNNHGQLTRGVDHEWYENSYNEMNGGMLRAPSQFWTDREAQEHYRRRLRYIMARWAYSPNIMAWEMFNEVDLTEGFNAGTVAQWHRETAHYIKSIDPWKHMISTHFCHDWEAGPVYSLPEIEFTPGDLYKTNIVASMQNVWQEKKNYGKATLISEYGEGNNADELEANFHGGLWSSTVMPMAGTAMFWWWNFVDNKDLYYHYRPIAQFNQGEDWRGKNWQLARAGVLNGDARHGELNVLGRQTDVEAVLWVYDAMTFSYNSGERYRKPKSFVGAQLLVPGLKPGAYNVEFWNTTTARAETQRFAFTEGSLRFPLPTVQMDMAIKIKRVEK